MITQKASLNVQLFTWRPSLISSFRRSLQTNEPAVKGRIALPNSTVDAKVRMRFSDFRSVNKIYATDLCSAKESFDKKWDDVIADVIKCRLILSDPVGQNSGLIGQLKHYDEFPAFVEMVRTQLPGVLLE